jgi:hypothetical protein
MPGGVAGARLVAMLMVHDFPLPRGGVDVAAVPAPGAGPGHWAGAPSAALDEDGTLVVAYRVRHGHDGHDEIVLARSVEGEMLVPVATIDQRRFGAAAVERPALVRLDGGRWRMYVSCATPASKHWWIGVVEASDPAELGAADVRTIFPGGRHMGVKDPVVRRLGAGWEAWICCHPLTEAGAEDRMSTAYATSRDGLDWTWHGIVLAGRPGTWDARGARLTTVLPDGRAAYDGRATAEENWFERTAVAAPEPGAPGLRAVPDSPIVDVRYLEVLALPGGDWRIYYEARLPDESHELRTELVPGAPR